MALRWQMYPENPQHLMRHFEAATSIAYGYLIIDLKPTTQEGLRMRTDVFDKRAAFDIYYKRRSVPTRDRERNAHQIKIAGIIWTAASCLSREEEMPFCVDCGLLFENIHNLQKHVKIGAVNQARGNERMTSSWANSTRGKISMDGCTMTRTTLITKKRRKESIPWLYG